MSTDNQDTKAVELANAVKKWWEKHKFDTTGDQGTYNVFDSEPEFVTNAKEIIGDWEAEPDSVRRFRPLF